MPTSVVPSDQSLGTLPPPRILYDSLTARYDVDERTVAAGRSLFSVAMVRDTNRLLEAIDPTAFALDERLPYWAELWPSSIELARHCLEEEHLGGCTVVELGCGLGLAGIAAAYAGARVVFTDYEEDALGFARYNARRNLPDNVYASHVEFRYLDWRSTAPQGTFDYVLAADIVYDRANFGPLLGILERTLDKEGCAIFTEPDRRVGEEFFRMARASGFVVEKESLRVVGTHSGGIKVLLRKLRRSQSS